MNKIQKEILQKLEKILNYENAKTPKNKEAYITACNMCGVILINTNLVMGKKIVYFGVTRDNASPSTIGVLMCLNCKFVNEQKIMTGAY